MRRKYVLSAVAVLAISGVAAAWVFRNLNYAPPRQLIAKQLAGDGNGSTLPIARVVLFSSGVGYFQREG